MTTSSTCKKNVLSAPEQNVPLTEGTDNSGLYYSNCRMFE